MKYLCLYSALILSLFGGVSFVIIKSGAQELKPALDKTKPKKYSNLDVRVNNRANLDKVLERSLTAAKSSVADINDRSLEQSFKINEQLTVLKKKNPTIEATISPLTGAVEVLRSATSLTKARPGVSGNEIVREFIQNNKKWVYGS